MATRPGPLVLEYQEYSSDGNEPAANGEWRVAEGGGGTMLRSAGGRTQAVCAGPAVQHGELEAWLNALAVVGPLVREGQIELQVLRREDARAYELYAAELIHARGVLIAGPVAEALRRGYAELRELMGEE